MTRASPIYRGRAFRQPHFEPESREYLDSPTFRGFPLGGIGAGGLSLHADGDFCEARTNHSWYVPARDLRGSFFAVATRDAQDRTVSRLLRRTHHQSPELDVRNVAHTRFRGRVPGFELSFEDDALPVRVKLSGLSGLVPHDVKLSALPAVLFEVEITNPGAQPVHASVLFSWQNVLGITGTGGSPAIFRHTFRCNESRHGWARPDGDAGILFGIARDFEARDPRRRGVGQHLLTTALPAGAALSRFTGWDPKARVPPFWERFTKTGNVQGRGDGLAAALAVSLHLQPEGVVRVPFVLSWWMPHYVLEKDARLKLLTGEHDGVDHGTYPARFLSSVRELDRFVWEHRDAIRTGSLLLRDVLEDGESTELPGWLTDTVLNSADSILTNSVLTRRGQLYTIEGIDWQLLHPYANIEWPFGALTGTNDQRLAGHAFTSTFFPDLDQSELETFGRLARRGKVPHGNGGAEIALGDTRTPYSKPIPWLNRGHRDWPDLSCSWILQLGKLAKATGRRSLVDRWWPRMLEASEYLEGLVVDGVPEGASTYDIFLYEPCFLYTATLYVATNRMLADLAEVVSSEMDPAARRACFEARADRALAAIERKLWVGDPGFYRVCDGKDTVFQGGLAGDWIARTAGLRPVLPIDKARSHARLQHRLLVRATRERGPLPTRFGGRPLPFNEATLDGEEVPLKFFGRTKRSVNYIYQAVAYQALEAIRLGCVEEGLDTLKLVYDKVYAEGYPWDMNLVGLPGFVYMTHPAAWALFDALTGAALDRIRGTLELGPKTLPGRERLRCPVFFPWLWLGIEWDAGRRAGRLRVLKSFESEPTRVQRLVLRDAHDQVDVREVALTLQAGAEYPI